MKIELPSRRALSRNISCDPSLVWDILTDYTAWPEWFPLVTQAKQRARETNFALIDMELAPFPGRKVAIECAHAPHTRVLAKSMIGQDPDFILDWTIAPASPGESLVTVKCIWIHTPANFQARSALNPDLWLNALATQAASFAADLATGPADPSTILEIFENEGGLICWYKGTKYEMKAVS